MLGDLVVNDGSVLGRQLGKPRASRVAPFDLVPRASETTRGPPCARSPRPVYRELPARPAWQHPPRSTPPTCRVLERQLPAVEWFDLRGRAPGIAPACAVPC